MLKLFIDHPASVGETYFGHLLTASAFAIKLFIGAIVCLVHAVLPFLFKKTGSRIITDLHGRMVLHRQKHTARADPLLRQASAPSSRPLPTSM
jgi:hypothetical protein